jgi:hypothetical protein
MGNFVLHVIVSFTASIDRDRTYAPTAAQGGARRGGASVPRENDSMVV